MPTLRHSLGRRQVLCALLAGAAAPSFAQGYPGKPITLVVPYPAGAVTDRIARVVAEELRKRLGQQVVVENLGGASGTLAGQKVVRSAADGYTLLLGTVNDMVLGPLVVKKAGYSVKDFTPIARIGSAPTILVANNNVAASNADELAALAKRSAQPLSMGASGLGTVQALGGVMFAEAVGVKFAVVPYKGGGPMITDLLGGQIDLAAISMPSVLPLIRQGKLKSIGLIAAQRDPRAPELSTVNEGKLAKGLQADLWAGLAGPPNLPPAVVARLSSAVRDILADPAFREAEAKAGNMIAEFEEPAAFRQFLLREEARLKALASTVVVE